MSLDFQPEFRESLDLVDVVKSLRKGRLDPKFLYATEHEAQLWREVFLRRSPVHQNPEFVRIYDDAFLSVSTTVTVDKLWLIGLGPGTGLKEANLISHLKRRGRDVIFSAIDVSSNLVLEATEAAVNGKAELGNGLVADLVNTQFLRQWLDGCRVPSPRLYTFFGLVPNLSPSTVIDIFHAVLRPGDALLCSVHLAPVGDSCDLPAAMAKVLPQYDNAETLAWLKSAVRTCGLSGQLDDSIMTIGESEGIPAFRGLATWTSNEPLVTSDDLFQPQLGTQLEIFRSLRYTPALFEKVLIDAGFEIERLAMTACREEAIWMVRPARGPIAFGNASS